MKRKINETENDCDFETENVYSEKNKIYFYCTVNRTNILKLNTEIQKICAFEYDSIIVYINSEGGDLYAGLSGHNHIKHSRIPVTTIIDGQCASAATFLSIAGKKRKMFEMSEVLIHQFRSYIDGKFHDMKDDIENYSHLMEQIKKMYIQNTKISNSKLNCLLTKEKVLFASDCLKYGIIDEIIN